MEEQFGGQQTTCPGLALLSSVYDGEREMDAALIAHLEECSSCANHFHSFESFDQLLKKRVAVGMTYYSAENVKEGFYRKLAATQTPKRWFYLRKAMPLAAAFLFGMAAFQFLLNEPPANRQQPSPQTDKSLVSNYISMPFYTDLDSMHGAALPITSLLNVNSDGNEPTFVELDRSIARSEAEKTPAKIDSIVKHVWLAKDLNMERQFLQNELQAISVPANDYSFVRRTNQLELNVSLTAQQLVYLVRACKAQGDDLVSRQQPQPEQQFFAGTGKERVNYQMIFMSADEKK